MTQTFVEPKIKLTLHSLSAAADAALETRPLPDDIGKPQFRRMQGAVQKDGYDAATRTVTATISSETPVDRWDGQEVLLHGPENIDTSRLERGISHLYNHNWDILLGRTQSYQIKDKTLKVVSPLATNDDAKKREADIAGGYLPDVSLGYRILKVEVVEDKNGRRTYNVVRWMPYEWSSVTVPADITVGVNRAIPEIHEVEVVFRKLEADHDPDPVPPPTPAETRSADPDDVDDDDPDPEDEEERKGKRDATAATTSSEPTIPPTEQRSSTMPEVDVKDLAAERNARQSALFSIRNMNPSFYPETDLQRDLAGDDGLDVIAKRVADAVIKGHQGDNVRSASDEVFGRMSEKEQKTYSLRNAIVATINQRMPGTFKDKGAEAGFEREVSDDLGKTLAQRGVTASTGNIIIPSNLGQRSLQAGANAGSNTINTTTSGNVIDMLRARCRVLALGASQITVDTGLLRLPRQTGTASSNWLAELAQGTDSNMTFDSIAFSPKRNGIVGSYTLELLAQSAISVEPRVRADQLASKARTYDAVSLVGTGASGMPLGLLNMTGLALILTGATVADDGTVTAGVGGKRVTFVDINAFEAAISNVNGDTGTMGWLYTPRIRAAMRSTAKFPGTGGFVPLLPDSATGADGLQEGPLGYKAGVTTNGLPTNGSANSVNNLHTMILGVWENLVIANWGVSELVYDNITGAKAGIFQVIENEFMDVNCTHIEGFAASTVVLPS